VTIKTVTLGLHGRSPVKGFFLVILTGILFLVRRFGALSFRRALRHGFASQDKLREEKSALRRAKDFSLSLEMTLSEPEIF
jgi:hypothetical protein